MNRFTLHLATALPFLLFSCAAKNAFTISGTISHPGNLKTVYLLEAGSSALYIIDSANLTEDGKFTFNRSAPYSGFYKLREGGASFDLITKNGDNIIFTTDNSDIRHTYHLTGSGESIKLQAFNSIISVYTDENTRLYNEYQAKAETIGKASDSLKNVYRPRLEKNNAAESLAILKFVNDNKYSLAGFYAATTLDPYKYEQQLIAYAEAIKGKFEISQDVNEFIRQEMAIKTVSLGQPAPDFTAIGIDDKPISLADYKGKYVMIDFWASWCGYCRAENPNIVKQYAIYHPEGFNILGVSLDTSKKHWQQAIEKDKLSWAHASDRKDFVGPTELLYQIQGIPANFIVDPNGIIVAKNMFGAHLEDFLRKTFGTNTVVQ